MENNINTFDSIGIISELVVLRHILGIKQFQMADILKISRQTLSHIENMSDDETVEIEILLKYKAFLDSIIEDQRFDSLLPSQKFAINEAYTDIKKAAAINVDFLFSKKVWQPFLEKWLSKKEAA